MNRVRHSIVLRAPLWWMGVLPLVAASALALARSPLLVTAFLAAAALALAVLAVLMRRFGAGGLWMLAIPLSVLAGELGSVGAGGQSGRVLVADGVVAAGALACLVRGRGVLEVPRAAFLVWWLAFVAWASLGLLMALDPLTGVAELKEWVVAGVAGAAAVAWTRDAARAHHLLTGLIVSACAIAIGMLFVVVTHPAGPVLAVMMKLVDLPWGRSNYLAGFLILALPLALGRTLAAGSRREAWGWGVAMAICGMGLALSASKGAMLALVVTALPVFAAGGRGLRKAAGIMVVLLGALVWVFASGPLKQVMTYRLAESAIGYSMNERLDLYRLAWDAFASHPLLGFGINNFSVASHVLRGLDTVPHQLVLGLLAEVGLPGTVLALGGLLLPLVAVWRAWRRAVRPQEKAVLAGILAAWAGMLAHNQVESTLYGGQFKLFIMLLAAAIAALTQERGNPPTA